MGRRATKRRRKSMEKDLYTYIDDMRKTIWRLNITKNWWPEMQLSYIWKFKVKTDSI